MTSTTQTEAEPTSSALLHHSPSPPPCHDLDRERSATLPLEALTQHLHTSPSVIARRTSLQRMRMATAKLKQHFHAPHGHRLFRSNSSNVIDRPIDEEQRQKERHFISCFECNSAPLSPREIEDDPRNKELGFASKQLRVGDFQLIKTIGTGMHRLMLSPSSSSSSD